MLKISQLIGLLLFSLSGSAQKAFYYQEKSVDLNKFNDFYIQDSPIDAYELTSPFINKMALQDDNNKYFILYNELSLKNLTIMHVNNIDKELLISIHLEGNYLCGCAISSNYYKKKKAKKGDLVIDIVDGASKTLVWRGWTDLKKIKSTNAYSLYQKAISLILINLKIDPQ